MAYQDAKATVTAYDYTNQAWLVDDGDGWRYVRCEHPYWICRIDTGPVFQTNEEKGRTCYGTRHVGERPLGNPEIH